MSERLELCPACNGRALRNRDKVIRTAQADGGFEDLVQCMKCSMRAGLSDWQYRRAPIPSAEELAAMSGVCGSLRVLFANHAKSRLNNEPDGRIADLAYCQDALSRLDAARAAKGATT